MKFYKSKFKRLKMGTQNSRSSFKNNSSNLASNINNYAASEYLQFYSDSFPLIIKKINL